jgi:hypothetical protein
MALSCFIQPVFYDHGSSSLQIAGPRGRPRSIQLEGSSSGCGEVPIVNFPAYILFSIMAFLICEYEGGRLFQQKNKNKFFP